MYPLVRSLLFRLDPEVAHQVALRSLKLLPAACFTKPAGQVVEAMGLSFPHPIGLAAGFDKNGIYLDALAKLGFSFIEIGTVTPRPQLGNPLPRLFRLPKAKAMINRMGFNNDGVDALVSNVQKTQYRGILGINIGKNKDTPLHHAIDDYLYCLRKVYAYASYIVMNVSSPNTPDLRQLQHREYFSDLINAMREEQLQLAERYQGYVPLLVKLSPDETDETLKNMADVIVSKGLDGIIATNTTCDHAAVLALPEGHEQGGVSGPPLEARSTACLRLLKQWVGQDITLIGVGGVDSPAKARLKLEAGATLLQVYTGLIYEGPRLVSQLVCESSKAYTT